MKLPRPKTIASGSFSPDGTSFMSLREFDQAVRVKVLTSPSILDLGQEGFVDVAPTRNLFSSLYSMYTFHFKPIYFSLLSQYFCLLSVNRREDINNMYTESPCAQKRVLRSTLVSDDDVHLFGEPHCKLEIGPNLFISPVVSMSQSSILTTSDVYSELVIMERAQKIQDSLLRFGLIDVPYSESVLSKERR
jgi:hypothetical protein